MSAPIRFTTNGERIYRVMEGRAMDLPYPQADLMLVQLRGSAAVGDWWSPTAQVMADELAACIEQLNQKREAA